MQSINPHGQMTTARATEYEHPICAASKHEHSFCTFQIMSY